MPESPNAARRADLLKMRQVLMDALDECDASVAAQIVGQLRQVVKELAELPEDKAQSPLELAKQKRAARRGNLKAV